MKFVIVALAGVGLFSAGCAQVKVTRAASSSEPGVHFWEPWPYLVVAEKTVDKGKEYSTSIVYLPRTDREFVVNVEPGWGTVDGSVELNNGWMLSKLGSKLDSKGPETVTAITGLIAGVAGAIKSTDGTLPPGVYRIDFDDKGFASRLTPVFRD